MPNALSRLPDDALRAATVPAPYQGLTAGEHNGRASPDFRRELHPWAVLALAALAIAGVFAVLLILSRLPQTQSWLPWVSQDFFRRALVTHVMFSFVVWYLAALGALLSLAAARLEEGSLPDRRTARLALGLTLAGSVLLFGPALLDLGEPSLNNYVPVLVHPVYFSGVALLFAGVAVAAWRLLRRLPQRWMLADPLTLGLAITAGLYLLALLCFVLAWSLIPAATALPTRIEAVFWGGGHLLQFVNTALVLLGWQMLSEAGLGRPALPGRAFVAAMATLVLFALPAPLFYTVYSPLDIANKDAFTNLLWYGLLPAPALVAAGVAWNLGDWRSWPETGSVARTALVLSLLLFGVGGGMGYFLGPADTRIPSHYHAVIGGVNLVLMGLYFTLFLPTLLRRPPTVRGPKWILGLYGFGQLVWSVGMFAAGAQGVPRKTGGAEQGLDSLGKMLSMGITGLGGALAVIGGVLFIAVTLSRLLARRDRLPIR